MTHSWAPRWTTSFNFILVLAPKFGNTLLDAFFLYRSRCLFALKECHKLNFPKQLWMQACIWFKCNWRKTSNSGKLDSCGAKKCLKMRACCLFFKHLPFSAFGCAIRWYHSRRHLSWMMAASSIWPTWSPWTMILTAQRYPFGLCWKWTKDGLQSETSKLVLS